MKTGMESKRFIQTYSHSGRPMVKPALLSWTVTWQKSKMNLHYTYIHDKKCFLVELMFKF